MIYYIIIISIISFILFGIDKKRSIKHKERIPEKVLLFFTFIGGAYGSLFAMFYFHHKNRKIKFITLVPLTCIIIFILFIKKVL